MAERAWLTCETPLGLLRIGEDSQGVASVRFTETPAPPSPEPGSFCPVAAGQIAEYFAGRRREFTVALSPAGTAFQRRVWAALQGIPFGEARSYGVIAAALGMPGAARAVGAACRVNPILLLIPCHRVIGGNGQLTGYAAGLERKEALLRLEGGGSMDL